MRRLLFLAALLPCLGLSQGIRKNFTEMTTAEKDGYVNALNALYNSNQNLDAVMDLGNNYWQFFGDVNYNGCEYSQFLTFHRMMLWEMERALQTKNPRLTIPYWDWTVNNSPNDELFTSFLSPNRLPAGWNVIRNLGAVGSLPSASTVQSAQNRPSFCDPDEYDNSYREHLEYDVSHPVFQWVGGIMSSHDPRDPLFYLHHAMVDKLWDDWNATRWDFWTWVDVMDRYDGSTNGVYIQPLPETNPWEIVMPGHNLPSIVYAKNDTAVLDQINVQNFYANPEYYSYPGNIVIKNLEVEGGKNAVLVTRKRVVANNPIWFRVNGTLRIDIGDNYYDNFSLAKPGAEEENPGDQKGFSRPGLEERLFIVKSSRGFAARLWLQEAADVSGSIVGVDGKLAARLAEGARLNPGYHEFQLDVPRGGMHYAFFRVGDKVYKRLLPRL